MSKVFKDFINNPALIFESLGARGFFRWMSDEKYLKKLYRIRMGKKLDLDNPQTYNEKLQWLKIHDRKPEYTQMVDKAEAKKIVAGKIGEEYIIPTLGVYEKWDDIDFDKLPNSFVIKCTHDSGGLVIVKDKNSFDKKAAKKKINKSLKRNYYYGLREWPYKDVKPRIIIEEFISNEGNGDALTDYKFFCFKGKADCVMVCIDREIKDTKFYFFNKKWEFKRLNIRGINVSKDFTLPKPKRIDKMFEIAECLSKDYPFVRVDLYQSCGKIYFGEMTFFPESGFDGNLLRETDNYFGRLIDITDIKKNSMEHICLKR